MKTKKQIEKAVNKVAKLYNAKVMWSRINGITWLTMYGSGIHPKIFDEITTKLSQETTVDCYFHKCSINSIEIAFNAEMNYTKDGQEVGDNDIPQQFKVERMQEYGTLFK